MTRTFIAVLLAVFTALATLAWGALGVQAFDADPAEESPLWPEIEPFESGYLKVSDVHELYYELCGNPDGKPVFCLHGGPGGRCSPYMRRFFNPEKFLIVLHDQRGAGRSKPYVLSMRSRTSGGTGRSPMIRSAGLPGVVSTSTKTSVSTPRISGTEIARRLAT